MKISGPCLELFWCRRSGVGPGNLYLNRHPTPIVVRKPELAQCALKSRVLATILFNCIPKGIRGSFAPNILLK